MFSLKRFRIENLVFLIIKGKSLNQMRREWNSGERRFLFFSILEIGLGGGGGGVEERRKKRWGSRFVDRQTQAKRKPRANKRDKLWPPPQQQKKQNKT